MVISMVISGSRTMVAAQTGFENALVATDFSPSADAALQQATWLGRSCGAKLVVAHVLEDLRWGVHSLPHAVMIA